MRPATVLLTGATGHLGAAIARELLEETGAAHLRLFVRSEAKLRRLAVADDTLAGLLECERVVDDIRDNRALDRAMTDVRCVVHACHSHEYWHGARYLLDVNVGGARNVVRAIERASSVERVVFIGSYSAHSESPVVEDLEALSRASPRECSSRSKRIACEIFRASAASASYRLDIVSPSYLIGPLQLDPTYFGALFHLVLLAPLRWCPPNGINVVDVRDVARAVAGCVRSDSAHGLRILASGDNVALRELFSEMNRQAGFAIMPRRLPSSVFRAMPCLRQFGSFGRHYFGRDHYVDSGGLSLRRYPLRESVHDTLAWARLSPLYSRRIEFVRWVAQRYLF